MKEFLYLITPAEWPVLSEPVAAVWASDAAIARTKVRQHFKISHSTDLRATVAMEEGNVILWKALPS